MMKIKVKAMVCYGSENHVVVDFIYMLMKI